MVRRNAELFVSNSLCSRTPELVKWLVLKSPARKEAPDICTQDQVYITPVEIGPLLMLILFPWPEGRAQWGPRAMFVV